MASLFLLTFFILFYFCVIIFVFTLKVMM